MPTLSLSRKTVVLDLRMTLPQEWRFRVFDIFDNLKIGDTLKVVHDRDPRPIHYQMLLERRGQFAWEAHQESPEEWQAWIRKLR